ncbi:hypothetical protein C8Q78DRAFT_989334 [Trametes maxima]|nr:hypothetical protein C8Q78DRAFT_989334 [Trametes maxima]
MRKESLWPETNVLVLTVKSDGASPELFIREVLGNGAPYGTNHVWCMTAYLRHELEKRNKVLPTGTPRISSLNKDVVGKIATQWKSMGTEEKERMAETLILELEELREMKSLSLQTVPISSFHDVCRGMSKMFEDAALDFFPITLRTTLDDLVSSFKVYSLSGVPGLVGCSIDVIQGLQSHASGLIVQKLDKFGVMINNWPLPCFSSPSNLCTYIELMTLINFWETGVSWFRKLTRRMLSPPGETTPGPSVAPEKTLALPASKPRKRWSDFGTSRKKHKGAAADATKTGGDTEALAMSHPTAAAATTSHTTTSTPPSTTLLEPTPPSVGLVMVTGSVPTLSGTLVSTPPGPPAVGAASTSFTSTCPGMIVSMPTVVPAPATVGASATASQSVFNLLAFSFAPEPLPSPGPWGYNPAVHPSLGVVPHQWHITPDCMIDPALRDMTPAGLDDSTPSVNAAPVPAIDTRTFIQYNHEANSSHGGRGKRSAGRACTCGRSRRGHGRGGGKSNAPES